MVKLDDLTRPLPFKARRESSYDRTGGNADVVRIEPNTAKTIFDVKAAGKIRHIWMAVATEEEYYLRRNLIRMYWDGEEKPSVECPIGDFFGLGHCRSYEHSNACFSTSVNNDPDRIGQGVALNCWIPMPFRSSARVEFVSEQDLPISLYFYIDWSEFESLPEDTFTFHAAWKRENPVTLPKVEGDPLYDEMLEGRNLTDKYNYRLLYAEGRGNYLGVNMSVDNRAGDWWGEGDDMIFIDRPEGTPECGGTWPPDMHGTGSEDYFCHAWGMQKTHNAYCGEPWCEDHFFARAHNCNGKVVVYRFHIADPIPFENKIRVSIETGHANDRNECDDVASTVYWYQQEPHSPLSFDEMLPVEKRLPQGPSKVGRRLVEYM